MGVGIATFGGAALIGGVVLMLLPNDPYVLAVAPTVSDTQASLTLSLSFH